MFALLLALATPAHALSVEVLAASERTSVDTMFFAFLPARDAAGEEHATRFLLFQRVRGSFGYDAESAPAFGITTALSWNPEALHGVAPVLVGQVLSTGPVAKAGLQYARVRPRATVFGWAVAEVAARSSVDAFLLGRYTHPITERVGWSVAAEALVTVPLVPDEPLSLTERARAGLVLGAFQIGPGIDLAQVGTEPWTTTLSVGGFVRADL